MKAKFLREALAPVPSYGLKQLAHDYSTVLTKLDHRYTALDRDWKQITRTKICMF